MGYIAQAARVTHGRPDSLDVDLAGAYCAASRPSPTGAAEYRRPATTGETSLADAKAGHDLRHQELRHHEKARTWLDSHDVAYAFHDYKAVGISRELLESWARAVGWEALLNRAGTTFRKLPDADRDGLTEKKAIALMLAQPSMIKRPVLDHGGALLVGFKPEAYAKAFGLAE
jgi:arsenate reductase